MKSKIINYDYNRTENTLSVSYSSGAVCTYSVDCSPKSVQAFVMEDIVYSILSSYEQKFIEEISLISSCINGFSSSVADLVVRRSCLTNKLSYVSKLLSQSLIGVVSTLVHWYFALSNDIARLEAYNCTCDFFKSDYNFIRELITLFKIPVDDDSFEFTVEHLLSIRFPEPDTTASEQEQEQETIEVSEHSNSDTTKEENHVEEPNCLEDYDIPF